MFNSTWQDPQGEEELERPLSRERLMEAVWPEMAYGDSGDPAPSLIPYQVISLALIPPPACAGCNVVFIYFMFGILLMLAVPARAAD